MTAPDPGAADFAGIGSWYAATARGLPDQPRLEGRHDADVCVVGGGYTGLSAALHLAARGYRVALLEARRVGWGASGRNGGQVGSGQRLGEDELERRHGAATARRLWALAEEAKALVGDLVGRHGIACDLQHGQLIAAARPRDVPPLRQRAERLARDYGYAQMSFVPGADLGAHVQSTAFSAGLLDRGALHLHPLDFALGLARAALAAGVRIFERSEALDWSGAGPAVVRTAAGEVRAAHVVLACDGYLGRLEPRIAPWMMPINNFMVATAPLGAARAAALMPGNACVHDTRHVVRYFRRTPDGRLLFGGGESYRGGFPDDLAAVVRPHLHRVFPQLARDPIEYAWAGTLGVTWTRLPHLGRLSPNGWFAQGFSGHGIATGVLAGQLIAEAVAGTAERFDVLAGVAPPPFPGGTLLRCPLLVLGMLWYALRDRL
jgi:gamma-glutamylputrescine oxidase